MRTCRRAAFVSATILLVGIGSVNPITAGDGDPYTSPTAAYNQGLTAWQAGHISDALKALNYAAGKGVLSAQLRLAELYATGDGVEKSDAKSFGYYQRIANQLAGLSPRHPVAAQIAEAFVALAAYYRSGIAELKIQPDAVRAAALYRHAASYFGNVEAQYNLARMYLAGEGVNGNVRLAVNWLTNAARKHHAPSQALLGDLLWHADVDDLYHKPLKGLALIALARRNAVGTPDAAWIEKLYQRVSEEAKADQRALAGELASRWLGRTSGGNALVGDPSASLLKEVEPKEKSTKSVASAETAPSAIHKVDVADGAQQR